MGLFSWFKNRRRCTVFEDSYCLTRDGLDLGICNAIRKQQHDGDFVVVVAHFPETFERILSVLERELISFEVCDERINSDLISSRIQKRPDNALITLAPMLQPDSKIHEDPIEEQSVCFLVCERHPLYRYDKAISDFANQSRFRTKLGYYISLDDELLKAFVKDWTKTVMRQMGAKDDELITSDMVSRRVVGLQKRYDRDIIKELPASSAKEWFEVNQVA